MRYEPQPESDFDDSEWVPTLEDMRTALGAFDKWDDEWRQSHLDDDTVTSLASATRLYLGSNAKGATEVLKADELEALNKQGRCETCGHWIHLHDQDNGHCDVKHCPC